MVSDDPSTVRSGFATVTAGTLFLLIATLLLVGFNFLARVLIVRSVTKSEFDAFSLGFTLTQVLVAVGTLGIPVAIARNLPYAATDPERRTIVRTAFVVGGGAAAASGIALLLSASALGRELGSPDLGMGLAIFALALAALIAATLIAAIFQGFANVTPNALFLQIVGPGLFLAFLALSLAGPPGRVTYLGALWAYTASSVVTLGALIVYTARKLPRGLVRGPGGPGAVSYTHLTLPTTERV